MPRRTSFKPSRRVLTIGLLACAASLPTGQDALAAACADLRNTKSVALDWLPGPSEPRPGASLYGRVLTSAGKPVKGADVTLSPLSPDAPRSRTRTDARGFYEFKGLKPAVVGLTASHPHLGGVGPLRVRLFEGMGIDSTHPTQVDVGGLGDRPRILAGVRTGAPVFGRTVQVPYRIRRLAPDGRLGMLALATEGVMRLSPERGNGPLVPLGGTALPRAAGQPPLPFKLLGSKAPGTATLMVATGIGTGGELAAYDGPAGKTWCLGLPVTPVELAVRPNGPTWLVGSGLRRDAALLVSGAGKPIAAYDLPPGTTRQVALDKAGGAWLAAGPQGAIRFAPGGKVRTKISLPTPVRHVFPTPDGGAWATGGSVATRLDARGRAVARVIWQAPIDRVATDGDGRLWFQDGNTLVAADTTSLTRHPVEGKMPEQALDFVSEGRRQLWLLGLDRRTVSIVDLPCDCH